jgi:pyruvate/2-oxoglutarate dehydrogenase complex dihydrolipoamide acyltransferase (E2) component
VSPLQKSPSPHGQLASGDFVNEGDILCEIESDKATVEMPAEQSGVITLDR